MDLALREEERRSGRSGDEHPGDPDGNATVTTGIFKESVKGRVRLRVMNLEGDGQADGENHGGIYLRFFDPGNLERAREILRVRALAPRWRSVFEERLVKAGIPVEASDREAADGEGRRSKGEPPRP